MHLVNRCCETTEYVWEIWCVLDRKPSSRYSWEKSNPMPCLLQTFPDSTFSCDVCRPLTWPSWIECSAHCRWGDLYMFYITKGDLAQIIKKQSGSEMERHVTLQKRRHNWIWTIPTDHIEAVWYSFLSTAHAEHGSLINSFEYMIRKSDLVGPGKRNLNSGLKN